MTSKAGIVSVFHPHDIIRCGQSKILLRLAKQKNILIACDTEAEYRTIVSLAYIKYMQEEIEFNPQDLYNYNYIEAIRERNNDNINLFVINYKKFFIDRDEDHIRSFLEFICAYEPAIFNKVDDMINIYSDHNRKITKERGLEWNWTN